MNKNMKLHHDRAVWFLYEIVAPTLLDSEKNSSSIRLALLASMCVTSLAEYVACAIAAREHPDFADVELRKRADEHIRTMRSENSAIALISDVAEAVKHAMLTRKLEGRAISPTTVDAIQVYVRTHTRGALGTHVLDELPAEPAKPRIVETVMVTLTDGSDTPLLPTIQTACDDLIARLDSSIDQL
jgi:hypothetical protein